MLKIGNELKEIIKEIVNKEKNIITATCSNTVFSVNNYKPTLTLSNSTGDKLSISDGKIKIGADVKKVLVSASSFIDTANANNYLWLFLNKNNNAIATSIDTSGMIYKSCAIPPRLIDVKENDLINLSYDNTGGFPATIRGGNETWVTVEVVE